MASVWDAIGDVQRRRVLDLVRERPRSVTDLVGELGLSQPGVSKHLRMLRDVGLVDVRADGQRRIYSLSATPPAELDEWLRPFRAFWNASLDALESHLDENPVSTATRKAAP
jgi:DNA-binding transcriptional ArsR family regulator